MINQVNCKPLYVLGPDYSVNVVSWPTEVTIPSNATFDPIPDKLKNSPVTFDFTKNEWIDMSETYYGTETVQLMQQVAFLTAQVTASASVPNSASASGSEAK